MHDLTALFPTAVAFSFVSFPLSYQSTCTFLLLSAVNAAVPTLTPFCSDYSPFLQSTSRQPRQPRRLLPSTETRCTLPQLNLYYDCVETLLLEISASNPYPFRAARLLKATHSFISCNFPPSGTTLFADSEQVYTLSTIGSCNAWGVHRSSTIPATVI